MYFISKEFGDDVYGVTDTTDNVEEKYHRSELTKIVNLGIRIYGFSNRGIVTKIFNSADEVGRVSIAKSKLISGNSTFNIHGTVLRGISDSAKSSAKLIEIPYGITEVSDIAFESCYTLEHVIAPDSVKSFGRCCFCDCSSLKDITIPDSVESVGGACFEGCVSLQSAVLSKSLKEVGYCCFSGCSDLFEIYIPDSVRKLGKRCFLDCINLRYISIPSSVTQIGKECFLRDRFLTVKVKNGSYAEYYCNKSKLSYEYF